MPQGAGASERYLAQIEGGQGNPSVVMLKSIAEALELPVIELLPRANGRAAAMTRIVDLLGRLPLSELPAVAEWIEARADAADIDRPGAADRAGRTCAAPANRRSGNGSRSSSAARSSNSTAWSSRNTARAFPT